MLRELDASFVQLLFKFPKQGGTLSGRPSLKLVQKKVDSCHGQGVQSDALPQLLTSFDLCQLMPLKQANRRPRSQDLVKAHHDALEVLILTRRRLVSLFFKEDLPKSGTVSICHHDIHALRNRCHCGIHGRRHLMQKLPAQGANPRVSWQRVGMDTYAISSL